MEEIRREIHNREVREKKLLAQDLRLHLISTVKLLDLAADLFTAFKFVKPRHQSGKLIRITMEIFIGKSKLLIRLKSV